MTIRLPNWDEQYHSKHGALAEARHVFIEAGLRFFCKTTNRSGLRVLEIGFGTGLNAALTLVECERLGIACEYTGLEAYPVVSDEWEELDYWKVAPVTKEQFFRLHQAGWGQWEAISSTFRLWKEKMLFQDISYDGRFDLLYFDAFGARVQPELWTVDIFKKMYNSLDAGGILVTYSAKGSVRRAMQEVGFMVERLEGPPGKREMLRALKSC
jgi:tRNA U34 5-methylaminomethyl-2-thiouridine-forming methyltransferase MnmC